MFFLSETQKEREKTTYQTNKQSDIGKDWSTSPLFQPTSD